VLVLLGCRHMRWSVVREGGAVMGPGGVGIVGWKGS